LGFKLQELDIKNNVKLLGHFIPLTLLSFRGSKFTSIIH
jgi:hypothetical protein